jgi:hypothetical protein
MSAFGERSGHAHCTTECLLLTQSGHWQFGVTAGKLTVEPHFAWRKSLM